MALASGIAVNGLAIINEDAALLDYYRTEVRSGPDGFVMAAADYADFAEAMRRKLIREIEYRPKLSEN
jgi:hypothetical protein